MKKEHSEQLSSSVDPNRSRSRKDERKYDHSSYNSNTRRRRSNSNERYRHRSSSEQYRMHKKDSKYSSTRNSKSSNSYSKKYSNYHPPSDSSYSYSYSYHRHRSRSRSRRSRRNRRNNRSSSIRSSKRRRKSSYHRSKRKSWTTEKKRKKGKRKGEKKMENEMDDDDDDDSKYDDTIGSYEGKIGDMIYNRYQIIEEAGIGTFGRVLTCYDQERKKTVAIKVVRNVPKYTDSAKVEADILQDVNEKDPNDESLCVKMYKWFEYKGHVCLVFEKLGCSLYEYMKKYNYLPFSFDCIASFTKQLIQALAFLHEMKLIHTDLKLENVLLVNDQPSSNSNSSPFSSTSSTGNYSDSSNGKIKKSRRQRSSFVPPPPKYDVKVIDFGGATYDDESKSSIINTRQYRAPEVILGTGWSFASDIWSLGCMLAELYTGDLLFATHENMEHLALMEKCIGSFPKEMIQASIDLKIGQKYFSRRRLELRWPEDSSNSESISHVKRMQTLKQILRPEDAETGFLDLLQQMLTIDPKERITAKEALKHPFCLRNVSNTVNI